MIFLRYYLAIDIGASSGRHIVGWRENKKIRTEEVYRFPNGVLKENGHLVWDVRKLFSNVVMGIMEAFKVYPEIESLSIDKDLYALKAASAPMKQHAKSNSLEYFAEFFAYWCSGNTRTLAQLKELTPKTYAYFEGLSTAGLS